MKLHVRLTLGLVLLPVVLVACTKSATPVPVPVPSSTTASAAATPPKLYDIKFPNTHQQLLKALPAKYGKYQLELYSELSGGDGSPRDDPLGGHKVEPESCRLALWLGGQAGNTFAKWPYLPMANAHPADDDVSLSVSLVSLPLPWGQKYLDLYPVAAPQCTRVRVDGIASASIVERPIPGLGTRSRYVLRTYSVDGEVHREARLLFVTPTYVAKIGADSPNFNEKELIALARNLQASADRKLHR